MPANDISQQNQLYAAISQALDDAQIHSICQTLGCHADKLPAVHRRDQIREMILWAARRNMLHILADLCRQARPDFDWQAQPGEFTLTKAAKRLTPERLQEILVNAFDKQDRRQLCFHLDLLFDAIPGDDVETWAKNFISICQRQKLWAQALAVCAHLRPDVF